MLVDLLFADSATYAIPGAALLVSMVAVALSAYMGGRSNRSARDHDRINDMREEIDDLKEEVAECGRERRRLERVNQSLMMRLLKLENGNGEH